LNGEDSPGLWRVPSRCAGTRSADDWVCRADSGWVQRATLYL